MPTREQLEKALVAADAAGDTEAAQMLANELKGEKVKGTPLMGAAEVAASMGSSALLEAPSGLYGIGKGVANLSAKAGAEGVEQVQGMAYEPQTETGQRYMQNIADTMKPVGDAFESVANMFAERGADLLAPLGLSAIGYAGGKSVPTAAAIAVGGVGGGALEAASRRLTKVKPQRIDPRVDQIKRGDAEAAKFELDADGKVKKSKAGKQALYQGIDERLVAGVRAANPVDKNYMREMIDVLEKGQKNWREGLEVYPSAVAGKNIADRYIHVNKKRKEAGNNLDVAANKLKDQPVDFIPAVDEFLSGLDQLGIKYEPGTKKISFVGSDIQKLKGLELSVKRLIERMLETPSNPKLGAPDAYAVHQLKRFIDNNVSYTKQKSGLVASVENLMKTLRHNLDAALDGKFPEYDKWNTVYSETTGALKGLESAVAKKIDFDSPNAPRSLGIEARKLLSNYASGSAQLDALGELNTIANRYGGNFTDDIVTQAGFYVALQHYFPETFRTTFKAEIAKATEEAMRRGPVDTAKDTIITKVAEKAFGEKSEKEMLKAFKRLLAEPTPRPERKPGLPTKRP